MKKKSFESRVMAATVVMIAVAAIAMIVMGVMYMRSGGNGDDTSDTSATPTTPSVDTTSQRDTESDVITTPDVTTPEATTPEQTTTPEVTTQPEPEHKLEQIDGIWYIDGILLANKSYPLPSDYNPGKILDDAYDAFTQMKTAAAKDGIRLRIISGFRSYSSQEKIYNRYVAKDGREEADRYSARPGHSEHQSGLAMDLNSVEDSFADTKEARWIEEHCTEFGFIVRYPKGKEDVTGYIYEPWHVRYVGMELAGKITASGLSLEEYFGLTSYYADTMPPV